MRAETRTTVGTIRPGARACRPRARTVAAVAIAWLLATGLAAAQPAPVVTPLLNQTAFQPGTTLQFGAAVTNPGGGPAVDFYVGIQLPDGVTAVTVRLGASPVTGSLANLAGLAPTAPNISLAGAFAVTEPALLTYTFTGVEPVGTYTAFVGAVVAGGLRDGALGPGELVAFTTRTFTFGAGGILLPGPTDSPAVDATSDYQASAGVDDAQISVETGGRRIARTQLEVAFRADATVGQVNAALTSVNGRIVSMLDGVLLLLIEFPDPGSMAGLNAIRTRLAAMTGVREVVLQDFAESDDLPSNIGPSSSNLSKIGHLLAARTHAAWNTVAALASPAASRPVIVIGDRFGGGAPGAPFDVADTAADFSTGRLDGHGYHVLGIIGATFGGSTSDTGLATGLLPGRTTVRVIDGRRRNVSASDMANRILAMVKAVNGRVVVNTSMGHDCTTPEQAADNCTALEAPREARRWLEKVRGTDHVTDAGAGLEASFVHATSAGNADDSGLDSTLSSPWTSAAQIPDVRDLDNRVVPNATNILVVESLGNGIGDPTLRGCLSDFSKRALTRTALTLRSNVSAVGDDVWSLNNAATTAGDKEGTSMAAPQVAALAAWIWALRPSYTSRQVIDRILETAEAVPGCGAADSPAPGIDVFAAVLATDEGLVDAPVRRALLDVGRAGSATPDGAFDEADLQIFAQAFRASGGARDYSRHDLNGDGVTGAGGRPMPVDLDADRRYLTVTRSIGQQTFTLDERQLSDVDVLCFYAYSSLYTGTSAGRSTQVGALCGEPTVVVTSSSMFVRLGSTRPTLLPTVTGRADQPTDAVTTSVNRTVTLGDMTVTDTSRASITRGVGVSGGAFAITGSGTVQPALTVQVAGFDTRPVDVFVDETSHSLCFTIAQPHTATYSLATNALPPVFFPAPNPVLSFAGQTLSAPGSGTLTLAPGPYCVNVSSGVWECGNGNGLAPVSCRTPTPMTYSYSVTLSPAP